MVTLFTCLIALQFLAVTSHDWIDIPGWTNGSQVQALVGRRKLLLASLINAVYILPARGDNPQPNLLHVCFHVLFAVNLLLAILIRWR